MCCTHASSFTNEAKRAHTTEVDSCIKTEEGCGWICWKIFGCHSLRRWMLFIERRGAGIRSRLMSAQSVRMTPFVHVRMCLWIFPKNRKASQLESFTANGGCTIQSEWFLPFNANGLYSIGTCSVAWSGDAERAGGKIFGRRLEIILKLTNCDTGVNYFCSNLWITLHHFVWFGIYFLLELNFSVADYQ